MVKELIPFKYPLDEESLSSSISAISNLKVCSEVKKNELILLVLLLRCPNGILIAEDAEA